MQELAADTLELDQLERGQVLGAEVCSKPIPSECRLVDKPTEAMLHAVRAIRAAVTEAAVVFRLKEVHLVVSLHLVLVFSRAVVVPGQLRTILPVQMVAISAGVRSKTHFFIPCRELCNKPGRSRVLRSLPELPR